MQYDPYGEVLTSTLPEDLTDRLFTGARFDGTIGLYQMGARWYDPALGRWIQADTIVPEPGNPQALNRYSYVLGNPLRYTDPSGHQGEPPELPPLPPGLDPWLVPPQEPGWFTSWLSSLFTPHFRTAWGSLMLVFYWFYEAPGTEELWFGPEIPLTEEVRNDSALDKFREEWAASGYQLPFEWTHERDERTGPLIPRALKSVGLYAVENFELFLSLEGIASFETLEGPIDTVGGIFGSFDRITVYDAGDGTVMFVVYNTMGWASATRIPATNWFLIPDIERGTLGIGGTVDQYFYWWEPTPVTSGAR